MNRMSWLRNIGAVVAGAVIGSMVNMSLIMIGGTMNVWLLPAPMWFNVLDLGLAYFPMALLAMRLARLPR